MANGNADSSANVNFNPDDLDPDLESGGIVPIGNELPYNVQIPTGKLLDMLIALAPGSRHMTPKQKRECRTKLNQKLYPKTRPGFYMRVADSLHLGYAGQPNGHGNQHHWRLFYDERIKDAIEALVRGSAITTPEPSNGNANGGNFQTGWGGLYLRSEAEIRIAKVLDQQGVLFFANTRGRVNLEGAPVSNTELNGRIEADFLVFLQGKCLILEVDGQHHLEGEQTVRDYARDRMLLRAGLPTVRFTGRDCLDRPQAVVAECLSILQARS